MIFIIFFIWSVLVTLNIEHSFMKFKMNSEIFTTTKFDTIHSEITFFEIINDSLFGEEIPDSLKNTYTQFYVKVTSIVSKDSTSKMIAQRKEKMQAEQIRQQLLFQTDTTKIVDYLKNLMQYKNP